MLVNGCLSPRAVVLGHWALAELVSIHHSLKIDCETSCREHLEEDHVWTPRFLKALDPARGRVCGCQSKRLERTGQHDVVVLILEHEVLHVNPGVGQDFAELRLNPAAGLGRVLGPRSRKRRRGSLAAALLPLQPRHTWLGRSERRGSRGSGGSTGRRRHARGGRSRRGKLLTQALKLALAASRENNLNGGDLDLDRRREELAPRDVDAQLLDKAAREREAQGDLEVLLQVVEAELEVLQLYGAPHAHGVYHEVLI